MVYLLMSILFVNGLNGLNCYGSRKKPDEATGRISPELNRDYYIPPSKITWRPVESYDLKENDQILLQQEAIRTKGVMRQPFTIKSKEVICDGGRPYYEGYQDLDRSSSSEAAPTTLCDRLRLSLAGICTQSRWVWTFPSPLRRQNSFVDESPSALRHRTQVIDTRKRSYSCQTTPPAKSPKTSTQSTRSLYPYKTSEPSSPTIRAIAKGKTCASQHSKSYKKKIDGKKDRL